MPATYNFELVVGDSIDKTLAITGLDLTNYSAQGQMRKTLSSPTAIPFVMTISNDKKSINWALSPEASKGLVPGDYVYQIEIYIPAGLGISGYSGYSGARTNITLLMGKLTVIPEVSK